MKIAANYYEKLPQYMQHIFEITQRAVKDPNENVALQAIEFWSTVCEEEIDIDKVLSTGGLFCVNGTPYTHMHIHPYTHEYILPLSTTSVPLPTTPPLIPFENNTKKNNNNNIKNNINRICKMESKWYTTTLSRQRSLTWCPCF